MEELFIDTSSVEKRLVNFIKETVKEAGFSRVVIGLSGGLDSTISAYLAVRALGKDGVVGVMMPYKTSSPSGVADAERVIRKLGIKSEKVDITPMIDAYFDTYEPQADKIRRGNKMARERMAILFDLSKKHNALVLGTSNKTELLLGYGTLYGDTACSLNAIGDLYKIQVRQLARHLEVPERIIDKVPTADLWQGQTDEGELGYSYSELDRFLFHLIEREADFPTLQKLGFADDFIREVIAKVRASRFKVKVPKIAVLTQHPVSGEIRLPKI